MAIADVLFIPWPSWAKLSFVLGGLMILVICFASIMKFRNWRKIVRLERQLPLEQAERGEMVEAALVGSEEIPFGVKALELEPAVEGVWNARTTTPLNTPAGSRGSSPRLGPSKRWHTSKRASSISSVSRLDIDEPARMVSQPVPQSAPTQSSIDQKPLPTTRRKKANSITISYAGHSAKSRDVVRCPACDTDSMGLGFSRDSEAIQRRLLLHVTRERAGPLRRKYTIGGRSSPQTVLANSPDDQQSAIDRMDAHRKLHSAECGQLRPRARRNTTEMQASLEDRLVNQDSHFRATSWPTRENSVRLSQKLPKKPEQRTSPPAVPHRATVESLTSSKACPSAWTGRTQELMKEKLSENLPAQLDNLSTLRSMSSSTTLSTTTVLTEPLSIPNTQRRQVNNGFEVLPAGTLSKEPQVKTLGFWPATVADRPSAKKKRNKLQKRARSGSVSSVSSNSSQPSNERMSLGFELRSTVY